MELNSLCRSLLSQEGTFYQPPDQEPPHHMKPLSSEVTCIDVCDCSIHRQPTASEHPSNWLYNGTKSLPPCASMYCALVGTWDED